MSNIITVKDMNLWYGDHQALHNINIEIPEKSITAFIGPSGCGKSTFLKKLSCALTENGYTIEQYYCSFDPYSLDMVVCREMGVCVFDSTAPHEKFPEREGDIILDFYEESGLGGIDEKYALELGKVKNSYDAIIKEINANLSECLTVLGERQKKEFETIDEGFLESIVDEIKKKL